jgi:hypothetical protein
MMIQWTIEWWNEVPVGVLRSSSLTSALTPFSAKAPSKAPSAATLTLGKRVSRKMSSIKKKTRTVPRSEKLNMNSSVPRSNKQIRQWRIQKLKSFATMRRMPATGSVT